MSDVKDALLARLVELAAEYEKAGDQRAHFTVTSAVNLVNGFDGQFDAVAWLPRLHRMYQVFASHHGDTPSCEPGIRSVVDAIEQVAATANIPL